MSITNSNPSGVSAPTRDMTTQTPPQVAFASQTKTNNVALRTVKATIFTTAIVGTSALTAWGIKQIASRGLSEAAGNKALLGFICFGIAANSYSRIHDFYFDFYNAQPNVQ